jgi:hypothetical protein
VAQQVGYLHMPPDVLQILLEPGSFNPTCPSLKRPTWQTVGGTADELRELLGHVWIQEGDALSPATISRPSGQITPPFRQR